VIPEFLSIAFFVLLLILVTLALVISKTPPMYSDDVQLPDGTVIQYTRVDDRPFAIVVPTISDKLVDITHEIWLSK